MNKKIYLPILALICFLVIPLTSASYIAENWGTPTTQTVTASTINTLYAQSGNGAQGMSFNATETDYIYNITVPLKIYSGTPDCNLQIIIAGLSGDYTHPFPSGNWYAESDLFHADTNSLSGSYSNVTFQFTENSYEVQQYTTYVFFIYAVDGTPSAIQPAYLASNDAYSGARLSMLSGVWYNYNADMIFSINAGETDPDPDPQATPTPTTAPNPTADPQITEFTNNMINFIVPLCLLLLPAIVGAWALGKSGAAKWGFIAGLNIGAILSYLYLDAFGIWAIIIIVIVDVILVFNSSRGGE